MAEESGGERTEAPTPKRKQKAVEQGDVIKSRDFGSALIILVGCAWIAMLGPSLLAACKAVMAASFTFDHRDVEDFEPFKPLAEAGWKLGPSLLALFALSIIATIASQAGLGSLRFNASLFAPKASRINPASGMGRIFGANGWIELGKSLLKVVLLGTIGGWMLWKTAHPTMGLVSSNLGSALGSVGDQFTGVLFAMAAGMVAIAGIDLPLEIFRYFSKLRMTKQEIKDEHKEAEGSPEAKQHQRQRQREILKGGFRKHVQTAHVVLTNPTHFAVALRYDRGKDNVPVVVAKGRGQTALAIRELAAEFQVPVLEYPQLARAVYYTSKENQEVRDDLYVAIATVLAFVFGVNRDAGGGQPSVMVPDTALFDENGKKQDRAA